MDLDLSQEQKLLRDTLHGLCARHAGLGVVRSLEDDPVGYSEEFWTQLGMLGLLGLTLPEEFGGSGMSMLDALVVYEEMGRALVPSPHFVSSVVSGGVLALAGSDAQRQEWLPRIASGEAVLTPAWLEPDGGFGPAGVSLRATRDSDGWVLSGVKRHVMFARAAHRLLVLARADEGIVLLLVDPAASGVTLAQQFTISSDTQYRVDFDGVRVGADALVGTAGEGWATWDAVLHDGAILLAAQAVGGRGRRSR